MIRIFHTTKHNSYGKLIFAHQRNIDDRFTLITDKIEEYYENRETYIPNNNKFLSFVRLLTILDEQVSFEENLTLQRLASLFADTNSSLYLNAKPSEDMPLIIISEEIPFMKVVNLDKSIYENTLEFCHPSTYDLSSIVLLVNPNTLVKFIKDNDISIEDMITKYIYPFLIKECFRVTLFKLTLDYSYDIKYLYRKYKNKIIRLPISLPSISNYVKEYISSYRDRLRTRGREFEEIIQLLSLGGVMLGEILYMEYPDNTTKSFYTNELLIYGEWLLLMDKLDYDNLNKRYIYEIGRTLDNVDKYYDHTKEILEQMNYKR